MSLICVENGILLMLPHSEYW